MKIACCFISQEEWIFAADLVANMLSSGDKPTIPEDFQDLVFGPWPLPSRHQGKRLDTLLLTLISCFYNNSVKDKLAAPENYYRGTVQ